jgi:hypothetical protein
MPLPTPACRVARPLVLLIVLSAALVAAAQQADLNVLYIERTPKYDYDDVPNMPLEDDLVVFHGHIRYWGVDGSPVLSAVDYEWRVDGAVVNTGTLTNVEPLLPPYDFDYAGYPNPNDKAALRNPNNWPKNPLAYDSANPPTGWRVVTYQWAWKPGRHTVELVVDPNNVHAERTEANNAVDLYTDAILAGFWVEEGLWRYFHQNQWKLAGVGSNSWEDWIQRHMSRQNEYYENAIWDNSPQGVLTRVRIDRLMVVPDGMLPLNGGLPSNNPDSSDRTIDLEWGFGSHMLPPGSTFYANTTSVNDNNPFYFEKSLLHELGHARYLIDCYGFDVHNTAHHGGSDSVQIWEGDTYVGGSSYMPYVAFDEVLYYNASGGIMTGPFEFQWSPYEAGALNLIAYDRAVCGNMNAPCNIGVYVQDLPQNNHVRIEDTNGYPRGNADVEIYNSVGVPGVWYGKRFDDTPDQFFTSDANGYIQLPRNPFNPGGNIIHTYGNANGVIILRIQQGSQIWYRFMEVTAFNLEYWAGNTQDAYYTITLPGPNGDTDGDGLPDIWEMDQFGTLSYDADDDPDTDGLDNLGEFNAGTDADDPDSDDDELTDGEEVLTYETDPLDPDSDDDGWEDGMEVSVGTNPNLEDTDDDTYNDPVDNCPLDYNPNQVDENNNGIGDICEEGPRMAYVAATGPAEISVRFSTPVDPVTSQAIANYAIDQGVTVSSATLQGDNVTVLLGTSPLAVGQAYVLTVNNVEDTLDPPNVILPDSTYPFSFFGGARVTDDLVALWEFEEGTGDTVADTSGYDTALDLVIDNPAGVTWTNGGLLINGNVRVHSTESATKVAQPCKDANALTLEAWIIPTGVMQGGPDAARILTNSSSTVARNFMLGHGGDAPGSMYEGRARHSQGSGIINALPALVTPANMVESNTQHVVFTRATDGLARMYINGVVVAEGTRGGDFSQWNTGYRLVIGNEYSGDRPWLGELRLVSVYARALTETEVGQNYAAGPEPVAADAGACCDYQSYACSVVTEAECTATGGGFQGVGTTCATSACVCFGDTDCDGDVDFDDISLFVTAIGDDGTAWAALYEAQHGGPPPCSFANADGDGDGDCDFDDISPFVDAIPAICR